MIKKLTILGALLIVFVLTTNSANADLLDWAKLDNENSHPLLNSASDWSFSKMIVNLDPTKKEVEDNQPNQTQVEEARATKASIKVEQNKKNIYVVFATAYSSTLDQTDNTPFITAWNTHVRDGVIATNFLPFGTQVRIPDLYGDKVFTVEDRMNRRYTYRIDVWFSEREVAKSFGVKKVKIEVVSES